MTSYIIHYRGQPVAIQIIGGKFVAILPAVRPTTFIFMTSAILHAASAGLDLADVEILPQTQSSIPAPPVVASAQGAPVS